MNTLEDTLCAQRSHSYRAIHDLMVRYRYAQLTDGDTTKIVAQLRLVEAQAEDMTRRLAKVTGDAFWTRSADLFHHVCAEWHTREQHALLVPTRAVPAFL